MTHLKKDLTFKTGFEFLVSAVPLMASIYLVLAALHDWGYFRVFGTGFQSFSSISDMISNSLSWSPFSLLFVVLFFSIVSLEEGSPAKGGIKRFQLRTARQLLVVTLFFGFVWSTAFFLDNQWWMLAQAFSSFSCVCFGICTLHLFRLIRSNRKFGNFSIIQIYGGIALGCSALYFNLGRYDAVLDISGGRLLASKKVFYLKCSDPCASGSVFILRSFDKGLFYYDRKTSSASFLKWDLIQSVQAL